LTNKVQNQYRCPEAKSIGIESVRALTLALRCMILALTIWTVAIRSGAQQAAVTSPPAQTHPLATPLLRASANDELPMPAWGPYSALHLGPACLVNRLLFQQFVFPIVISQQREEMIVQATRSPEGKIRVHQETVTLLRRVAGLSSVQADADDTPLPGSSARANRRAHLTEADGDGLLWHAQAAFAPAAVTQKVAQLPDDTGKLQPPRPWGAADVTVDYFPAFGDVSGDGLLVRVTLTNRSTAGQIYTVDLLGGIDADAEDFLRRDLQLVPDPQGTNIIVQHPKCPAVFALAANTGLLPLHAYRVDDSYFASAANIARAANGELPPAGVITMPLANNPEKVPADNAAPVATEPTDNQNPKSKTQNPKPAPSWGLIRLSGIAVAPGQTTTLFLSVGVGKDPDAARASAQTLLSIADDTMPGGTLREGAYTLAQRAHHTASFACPDPGLSRLMAQALGNVPLIAGLRLGVPSRQLSPVTSPAKYDVAQGGMIALAYSQIQPVYAAAELNVWFQSKADPSKSDADVLSPNPIPYPPTNLLALWELLQKVHDRELLFRLYPYARRRHLELVMGGGRTPTEWRCAWPAGTPAGLFTPSLTGQTATNGQGAGVATPDYIAYVIRSARLLRALAVQINRPAPEIQGYTDDIAQATQALNNRLWDARSGVYSPGKPLVSDTVADLLPLIGGADALPPDRRAALLKALTDPAQFWSPHGGIRQVSKGSASYHAGDPHVGAVHVGINWLLWKGLLDLGETETAARLAANLLDGYRAAQTAAGGCPEWLDGDTGAAGGTDDFSGDACGLIPIYAAYHIPGTVSTGWNIQMLDHHYENSTDTLHLAFHNLEPTQATAIVCALGKAHGRYKLGGSVSGEITADADGVVTLHSPQDATTQAIDITPVPGSTQ
jgi:hypothetical protein